MTDKTDRKVKSLIAKLTAGGEHEGSEAAEALELKRRIYATVDLGIIGDPRAVPVLVQASKNKNLHSRVQVWASLALGDIRNPQAVPALIEALKDKDLERFPCSQVITALIAIGDPQAVPVLTQALGREAGFARSRPPNHRGATGNRPQGPDTPREAPQPRNRLSHAARPRAQMHPHRRHDPPDRRSPLLAARAPG